MKRDPLPAHVLATRLIPNVSADMAKQLNRYLLELGFTYVTLDLGGYQTGSMNKTL